MVAPLLSSLNAAIARINIVAGIPVLSGAGIPVSGGAGIVGQFYLDTSQNPNVIYVNVGSVAASSWLSLVTGNVV